MPKLNELARKNCGRARGVKIWGSLILLVALSIGFGWMGAEVKNAVEVIRINDQNMKDRIAMQLDHEKQREGLRATNLVLRQFFERTSPELISRIDDLVAKVDKIADDTGRLMTALAIANNMAAQAGETAAQAAIRADEAIKQTRKQATTVKQAAEKQVEAAKQQVKATEALKSTTEDLTAIMQPAMPAPVRIGPLYPDTGN